MFDPYSVLPLASSRRLLESYNLVKCGRAASAMEVRNCLGSNVDSEQGMSSRAMIFLLSIVSQFTLRLYRKLKSKKIKQTKLQWAKA